MATWDSADLLLKTQQLAGRPTSGDTITASLWYPRIATAQNDVIAMISAINPQILYPTAAYGSFPTMTTTDNQIFTFGTDSNGYPIAPIGKTGIYPTLASIPDCPWREGADYLDEGTQIRIPQNRTWGGTLYWRGITPPVDIDATHQAALFPAASRTLIVTKTVMNFCEEGNRNASLLALCNAKWAKDWLSWCLVWKTQFRAGGALGGGLTGLRLAEMGGAWA